MFGSIQSVSTKLLGALLLVCALLSPVCATETVLHSCSANYAYGAYPVGQLVSSGGKFYGVTQNGLNGHGNVFSMTTTGAVKVIHEFAGGSSDGAVPNAGLVVISNVLYGTTVNGGTNNAGVLFKMNINGIITILHTFTGGADGSYPYGALLLASNGILYGTTEEGGGANNQGSVFSYNPKGGAYKLLHSFYNSTDTVYNPLTGLAEAGSGATSVLYGVAYSASGYYGGIYKLSKNGSGFTFVHGFSSTDPAGYTPESDLIAASDGNLYGTCIYGGTNNFGAVYKIVPGSTDTITALWNFDGVTGAYPGPSNSNSTQSRLIQGTDGSLYGVTQEGGAYGFGTAFQLTLAGVCTPIDNFNYGDANSSANPLLELGSTSSGLSFVLTSYNGGSTAFPNLSPGGYGSAISLSPAGAVTVLQSFYVHDANTPYRDLVQVGTGSSAEFYGVLYSGGDFGDGAIFKINAAGAFSIVHHLNDNLSEGANPVAGLTLYSDGKTLFGSTINGGRYGYGTLFSLTTSGTFTVIHNFREREGYYPRDRMVEGTGSDKNLYGACYYGGPLEESPTGMIFKVSSTGSTFEVIHYFSNNGVNGSYPTCVLAPDGSGNLYGTTYLGGTNNLGTIFKINTVTTAFTNLFNFYYDSAHSVYPDGYEPYAEKLVLNGGILYGTTLYGGAFNDGAIWAYNTNTNAVSAVHSFNNSNGEGDTPYGGVILGSNGILYGTCEAGGTYGAGTIWSVQPSSGSLTLLHTFAGNADGANPYGGAILGSDGNLYVTTLNGGTFDYGTIVKQTP